MSDDDPESRTEEPTERKIQTALEEGRTPAAHDMRLLGAFAGLALVAAFTADTAMTRLSTLLSSMLEKSGEWSLRSLADAIDLAEGLGLRVMLALAGGLTILALCGLAGHFANGLPRAAAKRVTPELSRISPAKGMSRLFGRDGWIEFAKNAAKFVAAAGVALLVLRGQQEEILQAAQRDAGTTGPLIVELVLRCLLALTAATAVIAVLDLVWSRWRWHQGLRMTQQEVKDEIKTTEGSPMVRARLRSLALGRSRRRMMDAVPRATLVLANPTHYAIALRYVPGETDAPVVLALGRDRVALRIRQIAEASGVPVIEDKPLARSLHDACRVDMSIPAEFYGAVAAVIHALTRNRNAGADAAEINPPPSQQ